MAHHRHLGRPGGRSCRALLALVPFVGPLACDDVTDRAGEAPAPPLTAAPLASVTPPPSAPAPPAAPPALAARAPCEAPSRGYDSPIDAWTTEALERCENLRTGQERFAHRCGRTDDIPPLDLARLDEAVLAMDAATLARAKEIVAVGRRMGRNPKSLGLFGDSMTVSTHFLRPFSSKTDMPHALAPEVHAALRTPIPGVTDATIIDWYRGHHVEWVDGRHVDAFRATRAAQVGARASYPLRDGDASVAKKLIDELNPAVALVLFGGNDAAYRPAPPEELAATFEENLEQLLGALEHNGILPVLSTVARHGRQPGVADCDEPANNWRIAVATNAINRRMIEIACRRRLPLIDLRHAMDAIDNRGLGPDGVHPSVFIGGGAGALTREGLRCGYNVRNYVTLRMLKEIKERVLDVE